MRTLMVPSILLMTACGGTLDVGDDSPTRRCPNAKLESGELVWADMPIGGAVQQSVEITNHCTDEQGVLEASLVVVGPVGLSLLDTELQVSPGESADITVELTVDSYEDVQAILRVRTNDENHPDFEVALVAHVNPDQDGDGATAIEVGGEDCDDFDPSVFPGATEIWYDGLDSDCAGDDDYDQDGDGFSKTGEQAGDCDDTNAAIFPGAVESDDLKDNDCDGLVDEDFVRPGDVVVSELMVDPVAVFDASGEWFELTNVSERDVDMIGWTVTDFLGETFDVTESVVVSPGERVIFAAMKDPAGNGGVDVQLQYSRDGFQLDNTKDAVALQIGGQVVYLLEYDATWPHTPGTSMSLDPQFVDGSLSTVGAYWCESTTAMSSGDLGTPGAVNDRCTSVDHDGDGFSDDRGDCDDDDDSVHPGALDVWDGVDQDCDGVTDNGPIDDIADAWLDGESLQYLGHWDSMSLGDVDDDGDIELLLGTTRDRRGWDGRVYAVEVSDAIVADDMITDYHETVAKGVTSYNNFGHMGRNQADVTGDGVVDLVVGSSGYAGRPVASLFEGGASIKGSLDYSDAKANWTGVVGWDWNRMISNLDMDGDGTSEIVLGAPYALDPKVSGYTARYRGAIYILDGAGASGTLPAADATRIWYGTSYYALHGTALGGADVDGDGYDDLISCAIYADIGPINSGACRLSLGAKTLSTEHTVAAASVLTIGGGATNARLGWSPSVVTGDFDDDGSIDLALPSPLTETVTVFWDVSSLSGTLDLDDADVKLRTKSGPGRFGMSVAAGDFDDDGMDDLAVGAPDAYFITDTTPDEAGAVWVWSGATLAAGSRLDETDAMFQTSDGTLKDRLGWSMMAADLDGSGGDDLVIAAPGEGSNSGRIYLMLND